MHFLPYLLAWYFLSMMGSNEPAGSQAGQPDGVDTSRLAALQRHYKKISAGDFAHYDSAKLVLKSKYGNVFHIWKRGEHGFELDYLVFEKFAANGGKDLFEMDEFTQIKNDTTFLLGAPPLKSVGDTVNWVNGIWFYTSTKPHEVTFSVDSLPPNLPVIDYRQLGTGIYQFKDKKLVKICDQQTEEAFYALKAEGFIYLPNPGYFYRLANFKQIE